MESTQTTASRILRLGNNMKFASVDGDGQIIGFFDDMVSTAIPETAFPLGDAQYAELVAAPQRFRFSAVDGEFQPWTAPPPSLSERKAAALGVVKSTAAESRALIAGLVPAERLVYWSVKTLFAVLSRVHDALPAADPTRAALEPFADAAAEGFGIEADVTGETSADLQDRTIARATALFQANQLIEGMERWAEAEIGAAATDEALDSVFVVLVERQAAAEAQLQVLIEAGV
jgi:hypothetical protein